MKIKTSELSRLALDWVVAESIYSVASSGDRFRVFNSEGDYAGSIFVGLRRSWTSKFNPSDNWVLGGPLLDSYCTALHRDKDGTCWVTVGMSQCSGSDILEAFLRALVTERSGPEVEVPDELVKPKEGEGMSSRE